MIEGKNDPSKNLEKVLQALKQAKRRVANEKKKQNEKKQKLRKGIAGVETGATACSQREEKAERKKAESREPPQGGRILKNFNVNFIVKAGIFLYN